MFVRNSFSVAYAMSGKIETRENPKGFSLGWEGDGE